MVWLQIVQFVVAPAQGMIVALDACMVPGAVTKATLLQTFEALHVYRQLGPKDFAFSAKVVPSIATIQRLTRTIFAFFITKSF